MPLDTLLVRQQFPALQKPAVFLDNPGGTQIARQSLERMVSYLTETNANHEGSFETSRRSDAILHEAHAAMADLLNAKSPEEIIFGANMTTLTLHISRSLARWLKPGDHIVVTRLDHDANITPWTLVAQERGCQVDWIDFHPENGTLNLEEFEKALQNKPRLVAVGYASNALGTINPVALITQMAHAAGALVYVDAVQFAPHGSIDVKDLDCDFLVCSAYKFFGPHVGALYGRYALLEKLFPYKVRPASNQPPGKFETGTLNHEGIAGVLGAIEYFQWLGKTFGQSSDHQASAAKSERRAQLEQAMSVIHAYELTLSQSLLDILEETPGVTIYGITERQDLNYRVPTISFTLKGVHPNHLADALGKDGFYVWDGNYYALAVTERLGLEETGGMLRVGPVHYNTIEEIERFGETLRCLATQV